MTDLSERMCAWCGRLFQPDRSSARFCCAAHGQQWYYWRRKQLEKLGKAAEGSFQPRKDEPTYEQ